MKNLVCLDTHILIWGVKEEAEAGQEEMIDKAKRFLAHLEKDGINMLIPSIVVAEFLMRIPPELHTTIINLLSKGFMIPPFDARASAIFAAIWQDRQEKKIIEDLLKNHHAKREELKADCMIVATAISRNAHILYTHDNKLMKFAAGKINVSDIPNIPEQRVLFEDTSEKLR